MIAGLCESPLTFQAIIIWRDELTREKSSFATSSILKPPMPSDAKGHAGSGDRAKSLRLNQTASIHR